MDCRLPVSSVHGILRPGEVANSSKVIKLMGPAAQTESVFLATEPKLWAFIPYFLDICFDKALF